MSTEVETSLDVNTERSLDFARDNILIANALPYLVPFDQRTTGLKSAA